MKFKFYIYGLTFLCFYFRFKKKKKFQSVKCDQISEPKIFSLNWISMHWWYLDSNNTSYCGSTFTELRLYFPPCDENKSNLLLFISPHSSRTFQCFRVCNLAFYLLCYGWFSSAENEVNVSVLILKCYCFFLLCWRDFVEWDASFLSSPFYFCTLISSGWVMIKLISPNLVLDCDVWMNCFSISYTDFVDKIFRFKHI